MSAADATKYFFAHRSADSTPPAVVPVCFSRTIPPTSRARAVAMPPLAFALSPCAAEVPNHRRSSNNVRTEMKSHPAFATSCARRCAALRCVSSSPLCRRLVAAVRSPPLSCDFMRLAARARRLLRCCARLVLHFVLLCVYMCAVARWRCGPLGLPAMHLQSRRCTRASREAHGLKMRLGRRVCAVRHPTRSSSSLSLAHPFYPIRSILLMMRRLRRPRRTQRGALKMVTACVERGVVRGTSSQGSGPPPPPAPPPFRRSFVLRGLADCGVALEEYGGALVSSLCGAAIYPRARVVSWCVGFAPLWRHKRAVGASRPLIINVSYFGTAPFFSTVGGMDDISTRGPYAPSYGCVAAYLLY